MSPSVTRATLSPVVAAGAVPVVVRVARGRREDGREGDEDERPAHRPP